ncbi:MAG TPA: DinB family protein [Rubricoccaceae bacterium]|nr:DinB family protein [Rubricoccaceae bacterium]
MPELPPLKQLLFGDLWNEFATTRRVIERVPPDRLDWRPHPKSWPLGALATHLATLPLWLRGMVEGDDFDLATLPPGGQAIPSHDEILQRFDQEVGALRTAFDAMDDEALLRPWTLRRGEHTILTVPKGAILRQLGVSHIVHHRGQLSVYLRLLDVPVPNIYGPTADEPAPF